jgi:hypothetical protein
MSPDRVSRELTALGDWLALTTKWWFDRMKNGYEQYPNAFEPYRIRPGIPTMTFGFWKLEPDECLIIVVPDPATRFWSMQLATSWFRTIDFVNRLSSFTNAQAVVDDGIVRAIVSARDPGVPNWMDTLGLQRGSLVFRITDPDGLHVPETRVVRFDDLERELPATTVRIDPETRKRQIAERREQLTRLLAR